MFFEDFEFLDLNFDDEILMDHIGEFPIDLIEPYKIVFEYSMVSSDQYFRMDLSKNFIISLE